MAAINSCTLHFLSYYKCRSLGIMHWTEVFTVILQNDRINAPTAVKKRNITAKILLRTCPAFRKSVMISIVISKLGCTSLIFIEPDIKVNDDYYFDTVMCRCRRCILPSAQYGHCCQIYTTQTNNYDVLFCNIQLLQIKHITNSLNMCVLRALSGTFLPCLIKIGQNLKKF